MEPIAILVDSASGNNFECNYAVYVLPLSIVDQGDTADVYLDDETLSEIKFQQLLLTEKLGTSRPNDHIINTTFTDLLKKYQKVYYLTISSALSGTYDAAVNVVKQNPNFQNRIIIIDSGSISNVVQCQAQLLAYLLEKQTFPDDQIIALLQHYSQDCLLVGSFNNLKYLNRSGRLKFLKNAASFLHLVVTVGIVGRKTQKIGVNRTARGSGKQILLLLKKHLSPNYTYQGKMLVFYTKEDRNLEYSRLYFNLFREFKNITFTLEPIQLQRIVGVYMGPDFCGFYLAPNILSWTEKNII